MENQELDHIVSTTIEYKLNPEVIKARGIRSLDNKARIQVTQIFGVEVLWMLPPFRIVDIYGYFETQLIDAILERLLNQGGIWEYCQRHTNIISWLRKGVRDDIHEEMHEFITKTIGLDWTVFSEKIINQLGANCLLSNGIYHNLVAGYFESITEHYFQINVKKIKYTSRGVLNVTFFNDTEITLHKDFFIDCQIFDELIRETTTENLFADIKTKLGEILCRQKCT